MCDEEREVEGRNVSSVTVPHFSISIGAFAFSESVFTTEACAAPGGVYTQTQGPELQLDVSALQRYVLLLLMSTPCTGP